MTPWLVFIESNTSGTGRLFAQAAREQGFRPILLAEDLSRYKYVIEDNLDVLQIDTQNEATLMRECRRLSMCSDLAGITSSSEYFMVTAASLAQQFGLPGPRPVAVSRCRDKLLQRTFLHSAGIGVPAFRKAVSVKSAIHAAQSIGLPVVVKTVCGSGSVGVKLCRDADEVASHAAELLQQQHNERGMPVPAYILVEELVTGPEYSVETFNQTVIGITQKHLGALPFFVETGHDYPAVLSDGVEVTIHEAALGSLKALGLGWGPAHIELRVAKQGIRIIEINPRLAGGFIPELVRLSSGVDLIAETIRLVVGNTPELRRARNSFASIRFIIPSKEGVLSAVEGIDAANKTPGVAEVKLYSCPNQNGRLRGDFRDRVGHVVSCGDTREGARNAAVRARECIRLTLSRMATEDIQAIEVTASS